MQDGETNAVSVAAALQASKVENCSFWMLWSAAVGGYEAATRLSSCLLSQGTACSGVARHQKPRRTGGTGGGAQGCRLIETADTGRVGTRHAKHRWRTGVWAGACSRGGEGWGRGLAGLATLTELSGREWGCVRHEARHIFNDSYRVQHRADNVPICSCLGRIVQNQCCRRGRAHAPALDSPTPWL